MVNNTSTTAPKSGCEWRASDKAQAICTVRATLVENQQTLGQKVTINLNLADP
jgi:hypothetical protein